MHGAQAVMPGVACLYRCVGGFVIPDLTNTDNFGITSYSRTQSGSKTDHITPDFCLMRWEQIVFISRIYSTGSSYVTILASGKLSIM